MSSETIVPDNLIQESAQEIPLFSNGERLINETNEMLSAFENMLKSRESDDVISEEIIEEDIINEDVINEDNVDLEETSYENVEDVENTGDDTPDEDLSHENDSGETEEDTDAV